MQSPNSGQVASAHPFVNVIVRFGATSSGAVADPSTFRAKLGPRPITSLFEDDVVDGAVVGKRAALPQDMVNLKGGKNVLKLHVKSERRSDPLGRRFRDLDKVKFPAASSADIPPVAAATASATVVTPGVPITFDGQGSHDDDLDALTFHWDFGDGTGADGAVVAHAYDDAGVPRTAVLSVSDGQLTATAAIDLLAPPPECDAGLLPGTLAVDGTEALELGAVAVGDAAATSFSVRNDGAPTSQLTLRVEADGDGFTVEPTNVVLDAGASMPVTVRFAPGATGHATGRITVIPCADSGQAPYPLLAHGYGGTGQGAGPTLAAAPLFVSDGRNLRAWLPGGARPVIDLAAGHCARPSGTSTQDLCLANRDCRVNAESCQPSRGAIDSFDPADFCGDTLGNVFVLAPNSVADDDENNPVTGSLVRIRLNGDGTIAERRILRRVTEDTEQMACDRLAIDAGGDVFLAERHVVPDRDACVRDARESLTRAGKNNGTGGVVGTIDRIDQFENPPLDACDDDISEVAHLEASGDGTSVFFLGEDSGGIYRLRPTPLQILRASTALRTDQFRLRDDGALLYATTTDVGSASRVNLYAVLPEQAETGALQIEDLTPCATVTLPNQRAAGSTRIASVVASLAAGPAATPAGDGVVLVSVADPDPDRLRDPLGIRATVAFALPTGTTACTGLGVVALDVFGAMRF